LYIRKKIKDMKHSIRLLFLLLIGLQSIEHAFGQETVFKIKKDTSSSSMKTLFKPHKLTSVGLSLQSQMLFGKGGPERAMGFQVHLNNKLSLGIASFNSNPRNDDPNRYEDEPRRRFNALTMEITPLANKVFHLSFPLAIGRIQEEASLINYPHYAGTAYQPLPYRQAHDRFSNGPRALGVQPGINLEVNLFKYVKVFGGANYRFAFGEEKTDGMAKAAGTIGVKVGVFDYRKKR
jgi:hypothetical protein